MTQPTQTSPRLGEVVEASSTEVTVHCYQLYGAAPLGALVRTSGERPVYAVVRNVSTAPIDTARRPVARGSDEPDEAALYRSNPQLAKLLRTEFQAAIVGHNTADGIRHYLPPVPPRIHSFITLCSDAEVRDFMQRLDFLPLLLAGPSPLTDEATAAFLRQVASAHDDPTAFLMAAGREMARILSRDLQRLNTLLRSLRQ